MSKKVISSELGKLISQIDFDSERYYNLYFGPGDEISRDADPVQEAWTSVSALSADFAKVRGEVARLRRGVEQIHMPAIEAVGLDRVADQLRSLEGRLRPLDQVQKQLADDKPAKRILKDMLSIADALDRVFELVESQPGTVPEGVLRGLRSVYQLWSDTLGKHGLEAIDTAGKFDPNVHMAMGTEPKPGAEDGGISRVMLRGYLLDGKILRTAQVVLIKN